MTAEEYMSKLRAAGFTVLKRSEKYLLLQGRNGEITGVPAPEHLSAERRRQEFELFAQRNMLG